MMSQRPAMTSWKSELVDEPKQVRIEAINYAKKAKRVDIQKLKENIWVDLTQVISVRVSQYFFHVAG
jgi:hypothetical protein